MWRKIGSVVAGLVAWAVIVSVIDRLMRLAWPEYAAALPTLHFTLPMMIARLSEAAVATVVAGWFARWIARTPLWLAWVQGALILLPFLPVHYRLWHSFPVWYHLTFLVPLIPLTLLGASLANRAERTSP
ncbi:MAG TPA: hypothetical protein VG274_02470 [Rhizomicrobium sp.]|jgi:hypothetical protein|nr:hypothetical protein [Rhizomicrobium sp.]